MKNEPRQTRAEGEAAWERHYVNAARRRRVTRSRQRGRRRLRFGARRAAWAVALAIVAGALVIAAWTAR